jgi:hypothetical protein
MPNRQWQNAALLTVARRGSRKHISSYVPASYSRNTEVWLLQCHSKCFSSTEIMAAYQMLPASTFSSMWSNTSACRARRPVHLSICVGKEAWVTTDPFNAVVYSKRYPMQQVRHEIRYNFTTDYLELLCFWTLSIVRNSKYKKIQSSLRFPKQYS